MAVAGRIRSTLSLLTQAVSSQRSAVQRTVICPSFEKPEFSRSFATASLAKEQKVKLPVALYGISGNYASALYIAAVKTKALEKVEAELNKIVEASKNSSTFSQFMKDLSVPAGTRIKAIDDICAQAKFADITRNFLVVLAENGRLKYMEAIAKRFGELTMAHNGVVQAVVTTVIPLAAEEEKELKETLQEILRHGTTVMLEQKIDTSILGGVAVEFSQKVFDTSIRTRALQMERLLREPVTIL